MPFHSFSVSAFLKLLIILYLLHITLCVANKKKNETLLVILFHIPSEIAYTDACKLPFSVRHSRETEKHAFMAVELYNRLAQGKKGIKAAGVDGKAHATPKAFRHGLGVWGVHKGAALNMVQKWLGHAQISITSIYADARGGEGKYITSRMW
jgi:hypothetical protein